MPSRSAPKVARETARPPLSILGRSHSCLLRERHIIAGVLVDNIFQLRTPPTDPSYTAGVDWPSILDSAISAGHRSVDKLLFASGIALELRGSFESLHTAVKNGRTSIAKMLVGYGVSVNSGYNARPGALHLAAAAGNLDLVDFLLKHGAEVDGS